MKEGEVKAIKRDKGIEKQYRWACSNCSVVWPPPAQYGTGPCSMALALAVRHWPAQYRWACSNCSVVWPPPADAGETAVPHPRPPGIFPRLSPKP